MGQTRIEAKTHGANSSMLRHREGRFKCSCLGKTYHNLILPYVVSKSKSKSGNCNGNSYLKYFCGPVRVSAIWLTTSKHSRY
eukprot:2410009-Amphidinium_carterae.1